MFLFAYLVISDGEDGQIDCGGRYDSMFRSLVAREARGFEIAADARRRVSPHIRFCAAQVLCFLLASLASIFPALADTNFTLV